MSIRDALSYVGHTVYLYYTILSNFLVLSMFIVLIIKNIIDIKKNGIKGSVSYAPTFVLICMIDIMITFLAYWLSIVSAKDQSVIKYIFKFPNLSVHGLSFVLVFIDYILFAKPHHIEKKYHPYLSLIFPFSYFAICYIIAAFGMTFPQVDGSISSYPYAFMDFNKYGYIPFVIILSVLAIAALASFLFQLLDKKRNKFGKID